ncbi:MAG: hypothetical protein Tsb0032_14880 [Kiloniellaceae bacterium]
MPGEARGRGFFAAANGAGGMRTALAACVGLALMPGCPDLAAAQQEAPAREVAKPGRAAPGMIIARSFRETEDMPTIAVSPYDDSDLNLRLKADFEAELTGQQRGRPDSQADTGYLLLFETEVIPAQDVPQAPSLGSARLTEGGAEVNVNVWSSSKDSVLGGRQQAGDVGANVFHLNAVLRDRRSGTVAWEGDAYYRLAGPDTEQVARGMVAPLVKKMGQSVAREPFEIR